MDKKDLILKLLYNKSFYNFKKEECLKIAKHFNSNIKYEENRVFKFKDVKLDKEMINLCIELHNEENKLELID